MNDGLLQEKKREIAKRNVQHLMS